MMVKIKIPSDYELTGIRKKIKKINDDLYA